MARHREPEPIEATRDPVPRLSMPLKDDQTIDWERMRAGTKEKLLRDPKLREMLTPSSAGKSELPQAAAIPPVAVHVVLDLLGSIEQLIAVKVTGCQPEAAAIFRYSTDVKRAIEEPGSRLLGKYLGSNITLWADEIAVAGILTTDFLAKLQLFNPAGSAQILQIVKPQNEENEK